MSKISLDPRKLLGFKIVAEGSAAKLSSPKIGGKGCNVSDGESAEGAKRLTGGTT